MSEIVKVQPPMFSGDPDDPWMIYDQNNRHLTMVPDWAIPPKVKKAMEGGYKAFFRAEWFSVPQGHWELYERVPDKDGF